MEKQTAVSNACFVAAVVTDFETLQTTSLIVDCLFVSLRREQRRGDILHVAGGKKWPEGKVKRIRNVPRQRGREMKIAGGHGRLSFTWG